MEHLKLIRYFLEITFRPLHNRPASIIIVPKYSAQLILSLATRPPLVVAVLKINPGLFRVLDGMQYPSHFIQKAHSDDHELDGNIFDLLFATSECVHFVSNG